MFVFNGKEVATIGELLDGAVSAMEAGNAQAYLDAYRASNEHADANLGYVFGYCGDEQREKLYRTYNLTHPVFGSAV